MNARSPNTIDQHVGARMRLRRSELEMSQSELGEKLGVTFQQVQKYERGTNRVGASRLYKLAHELGVDVKYFFKGLDVAGASNIGDQSDAVYEFIASPDGITLATVFQRIGNTTVRRRLIDLMRDLVDEPAAKVVSLKAAA